IWAFVRPFMTMVVFTVVFGSLAKLPTEGTAPYAVLVFGGLLPWTLFATVLNDASSSVIANANLVSKVYFPRLIVPLSTIVVALQRRCRGRRHRRLPLVHPGRRQPVLLAGLHPPPARHRRAAGMGRPCLPP